jgi:hypothetical protein
MLKPKLREAFLFELKGRKLGIERVHNKINIFRDISCLFHILEHTGVFCKNELF